VEAKKAKCVPRETLLGDQENRVDRGLGFTGGQGASNVNNLEGNISLHENPEKRAEEQSPLQPRDKKSRNQLLLLAVLILGVGLVGTLVWDLALQNENVPGTSITRC
jgi:hypothetical protein